jgi:hypothetical protein
MPTLSKNGVGVILLGASIIGLDLTESDAAQIASAIGLFVSYLLMLLNQVHRPDVQAFVFKKAKK